MPTTLVVLIATVVCLFILSPKEAIGASNHEDDLNTAELLKSDPTFEYKGKKNFNQPQGWGCVGYLRKRGYYVPLSPTGTAGGIRVDSTALPPVGEYVVIVTYEGGVGHVALAINIGGVLIVRDEGNYGKSGGYGRVVSLKNYKGYVKSKEVS